MMPTEVAVNVTFDQYQDSNVNRINVFVGCVLLSILMPEISTVVSVLYFLGFRHLHCR